MAELGRPITEEEVWEAIRDIPLDKTSVRMVSVFVFIGRLGRLSRTTWFGLFRKFI
jgi:hypothetical protein